MQIEELEEGDWYCSMNMGIEEVRYLYAFFKKARERLLMKKII